MALKKSALYSSLWKSCDELRGGMDASQYKDYVLTLLFVKYISDKYAGDPYALVTVPDGGSFADIVKLKGDKEIGEKINMIISALAKPNDLAGVIDIADFNDDSKLGRGQEMVDRLSKLVAIFEGLDLHANRADGDDLLGDAYEYLMRHFATESGKSKGQFYTPAEVSRVMAQLLGIGPDVGQEHSVYDPACGSGSLLLKVSAEAPRGLTIYGQEMDNATAALARMNMILHGRPTAEIWQDNTLTSPRWLAPDGGLKTFDYVVANPPFSQKNWTSGLNPAHDPYRRFERGIPPAKNGDYAFLLHIVASLKSSGRAAVIMPHGVLFRGNAEATIRRKLVEQRLIQGIIGLPPNLFYGTGIPACIVVIDKGQTTTRSGLFMIDASKGFRKDGNKNRLREQDIHRMVDVFTRQVETPAYARLVPWAEVEANDFNLNIPRYVDASDPEDRHDLDAHLHGGIPQAGVEALRPYWQALPGVEAALFAPGDRPGYLAAKLPAAETKPAILAHPDFIAFAGRVHQLTRAWQAAHRPALWELPPDTAPKSVIHTLAEDLLRRFAAGDTHLIDPYDLYQHLMDYWAETMQDDVYAIVQEGWQPAAKLRPLVDVKGNGQRETPDLVVERHKYKAELIPPALLIARHLAAQQAEVDALLTQAEAAAQAVEGFIEEQGGAGEAGEEGSPGEGSEEGSEEGLLSEVVDDKGKVTLNRVKGRLKELHSLFGGAAGEENDEERDALLHLQGLMEAQAAAERAHKDAQASLDRQVVARYGSLTPAEIQTLVVEDKWLAAMAAAVQGEVERVTQTLAGRVQALETRYHDPLPALIERTACLMERVEGHLQRMGVAGERVA